MPRQSYPRSRRIIMQGVLCAVFFSSVALAEWVTQHHHQGAKADTALGRAIGFARGPVKRIALPAGWVVDVQHGGAGPDVFQAAEIDKPAGERRSITCESTQLDADTAPLDYLRSQDGPGVEHVTMGGFPGVILQISDEKLDQAEEPWMACCMLPDARVVMLVMNCPPDADPEANREILRAIATSIEFRR